MWMLSFMILGVTVTYTTWDMIHRGFPQFGPGRKEWLVVLCIFTAWVVYFAVFQPPPAPIIIRPWVPQWLVVPVQTFA